MALEITQFSVGGFDKNFSYLVHDPETKEAAYVDPTGDIELVLKFIATEKLSVTAVWLTHTHFDHIDRLADMIAHFDVPVHVAPGGVPQLHGQDITVARLMPDAELFLGANRVMVLHTPGHSEDSVCFCITADTSTTGAQLCITGDTLFVGGCGRTDEAGVNHLYQSLQYLKTLSPQTIIYPGHDYGSTPTSTINHELAHNKYLLAENFAVFKQLRLNGDS